jgi:glycosyltransferase involved in cell wall biosynthesis
MTRRATVLIDLRVAQINGDRGIPAYSQSLTLELSRTYPQHHWLLLHDPQRPLPARISELTAHAGLCTTADLEGNDLPAIDVLFTACFFFVPQKGPTFEAIVPPATWRHRPRRMGIVYDLIPLLFPDRYLTNEHARQVYLESLEVMRASDHLFAISHATRRDTILRAAVDPRRVHCIYGDIDQTKQSLMARPASETAQVPARHGLAGPYCAYVGGDDWRKNLNAAVQAFAQFWRSHPTHRLAIVCKLPEERIAVLRRLATDEGLPPGALVCTGYVSDEDLVGLVRHADMVVFPSLYEGLGLPVLEAYGCGTPVVGSNTSSVAELVLPELACDPRDPSAIALAMGRLLAEPTLRDASLAMGRRLMTEELGWARAAECVIEHIEERPNVSGVAVAKPGANQERTTARVALVTALPASDLRLQVRSLPSLAGSECRFTIYDASHREPLVPPSSLAARPRVLPIEVLPAALLRGNHDVTIFVLDGSPSDTAVTEAMDRSRRTPARRLLWLRGTALDEYLRAVDGSSKLLRLIDRGEIDSLIVDTEAGWNHAERLLGPNAAGTAIEVAVSERSAPSPRTATEPGRAAACSRGAA